jgi:hypothetical protein
MIHNADFPLNERSVQFIKSTNNLIELIALGFNFMEFVKLHLVFNVTKLKTNRAVN